MSAKPTAVPDAEDDLLMSVEELRHYVAEVEMAKAKQSLAAYNKAHEKQQALLNRLKSEDPIDPATLRAFLIRLKAVAATGANEMMIGRFPSELCTDQGRAINQAEANWPDTLRGRPRRAYEAWKEKLQPLGYKLKVLIIEWPNGLPGDIGMYLTW
jgi:anti-sigma factor RsiW